MKKILGLLFSVIMLVSLYCVSPLTAYADDADKTELIGIVQRPVDFSDLICSDDGKNFIEGRGMNQDYWVENFTTGMFMTYATVSKSGNAYTAASGMDTYVFAVNGSGYVVSIRYICDSAFSPLDVTYTSQTHTMDDPVGPTSGTPSSPAHVHTFTWQTIYEATPNSDGLEGEVCSCGATRNTQPISAMDYAINKYADQMIKAAKPGQKITLEFGEFNSFPRYMMEKVAARMNENITFVFKFKQNKKMQTVTIEPGTAIDLQYDWYGPDKMKELYGAE